MEPGKNIGSFTTAAATMQVEDLQPPAFLQGSLTLLCCCRIIANVSGEPAQ